MAKAGQTLTTDPGSLVTALFKLLPLPVAVVDDTDEIVIANSHFYETFPGISNLASTRLHEVTVAGRGTFDLEVLPLNDEGFQIVYGVDVSNEVSLRRQLGLLEQQLKNRVRPVERHQTFDLNERMRSVIRVRQPHFKTANITVTMTLNPKIPLVQGDPTSIDKVLKVLVANAEQAIRPANQFRSIHIRTSAENGRVRLNVSDNGCGNCGRSPQMLSAVSVAIGLCAEIVNDHGGELFCWNSYDAGSIYTMELPAAPESA
jgi:hypothetical protein